MFLKFRETRVQFQEIKQKRQDSLIYATNYAKFFQLLSSCSSLNFDSSADWRNDWEVANEKQGESLSNEAGYQHDCTI